MKRTFFLILFLLFATSVLGQTRILFSHQSVGRNAIGDPERSGEENRASVPLRSRLNDGIAFWDHDYYNYHMDGVTNAILDPAGNNWDDPLGFGPFRGTEPPMVKLNHLAGDAFREGATGDALAFRDSCLARFDVVMVKPGYRDMHMDTVAGLDEYQAMLNEVSDWWDAWNREHGTEKILVIMSSPSLRHPTDYSEGTAGWPNTAAGRAEAESDAAAYRELDTWLTNAWARRSPYTRAFSVWSICVNHEGGPTELNFTKDAYTGTGEGDSSGDHHLNSAGSDALQAGLAEFINDLADELNGTSGVPRPVPASPVTLYPAAPNPFNPSTRLSFELAAPQAVNLTIFDMSGRQVKTLEETWLPAGPHQRSWDGRNSQGQRVSSGVYMYRVEAGGHAETRRMVLLK